MKPKHCISKRKTLIILMIVVFQIAFIPAAFTQKSELDKSIAKYRKGELTVKAKPGDKVIVEQISHEFWFGCAISDYAFSRFTSEENAKMYKEKFLENFNAAVPENAFKWASMERQKGQVNYGTVDAILKWTDEKHIPLRGHCIYWGITQFVQPWLKELSDAELKQTLQNRGEAITSHYKGRFAEYDLNNEMVHGNYYEKRLGPDITKLMFQWAHNGDPKAKLCLNDYDILTGTVLPEYMAQIRSLLSQGVPIAGIGCQGHLHGNTFDRAQLKRALDSLAIFHIPIHVTEFNMPGQTSKFYNDRKLTMTLEEEEQKAKDIVDYYRICFAHPAVEGILMWGFWEGANWIPVSSLYKRDWTPTPAAKAYHDLIYKEWWTKADGKTDQKGEYSTSAFFGKYRVTVNGVTKEVVLSKSSGKVVVDFSK
jgi:GH35 family endo-1,4-beta-xylanase